MDSSNVIDSSSLLAHNPLLFCQKLPRVSWNALDAFTFCPRSLSAQSFPYQQWIQFINAQTETRLLYSLMALSFV